MRVRVCVQRWPHGCAWEKAGDREGAHLAGGQRGGHVEVPIVVELRGVSPAHLTNHLRHLRAFTGVVSGRVKESVAAQLRSVFDGGEAGEANVQPTYIWGKVPLMTHKSARKSAGHRRSHRFVLLPFTVITTASSHGLFDGRGGGVWALEDLAGAPRPTNRSRTTRRAYRSGSRKRGHERSPICCAAGLLPGQNFSAGVEGCEAAEAPGHHGRGARGLGAGRGFRERMS